MGDSSEKRRQRISEESQFIDSLLTPVALVSGFLLAVTFYLVDIEIRRVRDNILFWQNANN
ncbi:MAG: hypothetical protein ACFFC7_32285 [Candidatus Hermodarchaeota archaeon]